MKKIALIAVSFVFAVFPMRAQMGIDTLFEKFPNYFYNWYDSIWDRPLTHDDMWCYPAQWRFNLDVLDTTTLYIGDWETKGVFPETAVAYVPDGSMRIVGVAFGMPDTTNVWVNQVYPQQLDWMIHPYSIQAVMTYHVNIYDKHMNLLRSVSKQHSEIQVTRVMPIGCANPGEMSPLWPYVIMFCPIAEFYLDTPLDVTDTFYVSRIITYNDTVWPFNNIFSRTESHLSLSGRIPILITGNPDMYCLPWEHYRFRSDIDTGQWREDYTFGWQHAIMYPIISNPGDSCPQVRGVEVARSSATQVFLRWQGGVNHSGWQVAYGPAGTPPEDCTVAGEYTQPLSGLITVDPDSQYVAYVRARCRFARDEWGDWSDPVTIWINESSAIGGQPSGWRLAVSPNPAHGTVTVAASIAVQHVEVYDQQGRQVLSHTPDKAPATSLTLDISTLPPAVYTLLVRTAAGTQSRQLTVTR